MNAEQAAAAAAAGCPVHIHRVTDAPPEAVAAAQKDKCPAEEDSEDSIDAIDEHPSLKEYRRIKRIMGTITQFYLNGTKTKLHNAESMEAELAKLSIDMEMLQAQVDALSSDPSFVGHPKRKEYAKAFEDERVHLEGARKRLEDKRDEYFKLHKWSQGINEVCTWLEKNLDAYCLVQIPDLQGRIEATPAPELTKEQSIRYSIGLDEIMHNLAESRDFFQASVDGRLGKFHEVEKAIIQKQLEVLKAWPADNLRRVAMEEELNKDLSYVEGNMEDDTSAKGMRRRQKMLKQHLNYLKVLRYHRDKLRVLNGVEGQEREYDSKYTFVSQVPDEEPAAAGAQ